MLVEFTSEQIRLRDKVRAFCDAEVKPVRKQMENDLAIFRTVYKKLAELGLFQIITFDQGGKVNSGSDAHVTLGMVCEELGRYDAGIAQAVSGSGSRAARIAKLADPQLAAQIYQQWVTGETVLVAGFTEAEAGSDIRRIETVATPVPGGVKISGEKNAVTGLAHGDWISVTAREADAAGNPLGYSQFLLNRTAPGISMTFLDDLGMRVRRRGVLTMQDVFVPEGQRIGTAGSGMKLMLGEFNYIRASQSLVCIGAALASVEETIERTSTRIAFGRPLAANQAVAFPLVEALTKLQAARWLCYKTLHLRDLGRDHSTDAAMAKWWAPEVAIDAIRLCLRLNGHIAYSSALPLEQRLRDALGFELADGASEVMKLIVARDVFGRAVVG